MKEGDLVKCVSTNFLHWKTTNIDKSQIGSQADFHPRLGEQLIIDEILGEFIRFDCYDTDSYNWWHNSRFILVVDENIVKEVGEQILKEEN